jgi:hypothetical protein
MNTYIIDALHRAMTHIDADTPEGAQCLAICRTAIAAAESTESELINALRDAHLAALVAMHCSTRSEFTESPHFDKLLAAGEVLAAALEGGAE